MIAHFHFDKVLTLPLASDVVIREYQHGGQGETLNAIEMASQLKEKYRESEIVECARNVLTGAMSHGVSHIRAFGDVDTKARLIGLQALLKISEELKGLVDIQVVAFSQDGIKREAGAVEYIWKAMDLVPMLSVAFLGLSMQSIMRSITLISIQAREEIRQR